MKLSAKVLYACQVMAQLGQLAGRTELPHIEDLARSEQIPQNYLVQILNELRTAGLIISRRGKLGGYALARLPNQITLTEIVRAVDGELLEVRVENDGESTQQVELIWKNMAAQWEKLANAVTLERLMEPEKEMWYI